MTAPESPDSPELVSFEIVWPDSPEWPGPDEIVWHG